MKTVTLKIVGMHCTSCAMNIDFELEDIKGVKEASTNYAKLQTIGMTPSIDGCILQIANGLEHIMLTVMTNG